MSDLVVIVYPTLEKAEEVRTRLFQLQKEYLIKLADAVIATKSANGQVQLHRGTFWGLLIGVLFLNPLLGAAGGALAARRKHPPRRRRIVCAYQGNDRGQSD
jgi:uncharacterized membrane protein